MCVGIDTDSHVRRGSKQRVAMGMLTSMTSGHNTKVGDEMKVTRMTNMDYGKKDTNGNCSSCDKCGNSHKGDRRGQDDQFTLEETWASKVSKVEKE